MEQELEEIFGCGIDGVTLEPLAMGEVDSPFTPGVGINAVNGDGEKALICQLNLTAARELAFKILATCERAKLYQQADLDTERLVEEGLLPESEHPTARIMRAAKASEAA